MNEYFKLIHQLLPEVEQFLEAKKGEGNPTLEQFTVWLNQRMLSHQQAAYEGGGQAQGPAAPFASNIDMQITMLLLHLARHVKSHSRKVLSSIGLVSLDDFQFLLLLSTSESMTKSELIGTGAMEFSSGIEVIKRLLKRGLVEEYEDPDDRRSRRVKITRKGRDKFVRSTEKLGEVSSQFPGSLPGEFKIKLLSILVQLHDLHAAMANEAHTGR
jgi:DNA-binding MarR family transcriptional regulator